MQVKARYRKGKNSGVVGVWVNDPDRPTEDIIAKAIKKVKSWEEDGPNKKFLEGDEQWRVFRDLI